MSMLPLTDIAPVDGCLPHVRTMQGMMFPLNPCKALGRSALVAMGALSHQEEETVTKVRCIFDFRLIDCSKSTN